MAGNETGKHTNGASGAGAVNRPQRAEWCGQIETRLASFGEEHGLDYGGEVAPCIIRGQKCLLLGRGLARNAPEMVTYLLEFAQENKLIVQEERRTLDLPTSIERRMH